MGESKAQEIARHGLRDGFGGSFSHGYAKRIDCDRRGKARFRCKAQWVIGDAFFHGRIGVRFVRRGGDLRWRWAWVIQHVNEYCASVTPGRDCREVDRGHGSRRRP